MFRISVALCGAVLSVSACSLPELTKEDAAAMSNMQLCQTYSSARSLNNEQYRLRVRHELITRKAVTKRDLEDIATKNIRTGMKDYVAVCSWGPYSGINSSGGAYGSSKQFVMYPRGTYVYTSQGRVRSWQQFH